MFKIHKEEIEVNGKKLTLETGKVARQADGAIIASLYLKDKCKIVHLSLHTAPYGTIGKDYKENFWYKCVGDVSILALKPLLKDDKENWCPKLKSDILDDNNNKRFSGVHPSAKGHQKIAENITRLIK